MNSHMAAEEGEGVDLPVLDHEEIERGTDIVGITKRWPRSLMYSDNSRSLITGILARIIACRRRRTLFPFQC